MNSRYGAVVEKVCVIKSKLCIKEEHMGLLFLPVKNAWIKDTMTGMPKEFWMEENNDQGGIV